MATSLNDRLAAAIQSGNFEVANVLVGEILTDTLTRLSSIENVHDKSDFLRQAILNLKHQLLLARIARSHVVARLEALTREVSYRSLPPERHSWQFVG